MSNTALKSVIPVEGLAKPKGVWSVAIASRPGKMVFVSGLLSKDENGNIVGIGDVGVQTEQVLKNLTSALKSAGGTLADVVRVDVYVRDISKFDEIHAVRRRYFPAEPPTSTMVEVSRLTDERCLIEVTAIAVLPE
ncbi:RidA family protein [Ferrovibrio sp.]|uniref:RidA family protein n=1 Tax=Ferrovibrio sp. TaxID=1917215 RepID=UPI003D29F12D